MEQPWPVCASSATPAAVDEQLQVHLVAAERVDLVHGHAGVLQRPLAALAAVVVEDQFLVEVVQPAHRCPSAPHPNAARAEARARTSTSISSGEL